VQFMRMPVGNEKEYQKGKEKQTKKQKEITDLPLYCLFPANLLNDAAQCRFVDCCFWLKTVRVHIS
jgi:hypothetical protein